MWNPFRAVGDFVGRVSGAVSGGIGRITGGIVDAVRAPFGGREATPPEPAPPPYAPPEQPSAPPAPSPEYEPMLPPSMVGGAEGGTAEISGESEAALGGAISEFDASDITSPEAVSWLEAPNFSDMFNQYVTGSGFSPEQWAEGMSNVRNVRITDIGDGMIEVSFEADFEIGDYDLGGRTVTAIF